MGRGPEQAFSQRRHTRGQQARRCTALLVIREMQVKTTRRHHLTPVRVATVEKRANINVIYYHSHVESKNTTNCEHKKEQRNSQIKRTSGYQWGEGTGDSIGEGGKKYKRLGIK